MGSKVAFCNFASVDLLAKTFDRMQEAIAGLSRLLLTLQGDGDYEGALELTNTKGVIGDQLQADLDRLTQANIPVDITFNQGLAELGLD